jgi:hypothetical protein
LVWVIIDAAIVAIFVTRVDADPVGTWGRIEGLTILVLALAFGVPMGWQFGKHW